MERGHVFVGGVERDFGDARKLLSRSRNIDASFRGQDDKRSFRRVANDLAVCHGRIRTERHRQHDVVEIRIAFARNAHDPAIKQGEELFRKMGCASCHMPTLQTKSVKDFPELAGLLDAEVE